LKFCCIGIRQERCFFDWLFVQVSLACDTIKDMSEGIRLAGDLAENPIVQPRIRQYPAGRVSDEVKSEKGR
jgi:hypothetical protein